MLYSKERLEHCRRAGRIEGFIAVASGQLKLASRIGAPLGRAPPLARDAGHLQSGVRPLSGILRLHKTTDPEATSDLPPVFGPVITKLPGFWVPLQRSK